MNYFFLAADNGLKAPNVNADQLLSAGLGIALWGIGILSVCIILYAALRIITARGDVEKVKKGRLAITWGLVGLVIAIMAGTIINIVTSTFG
jgi:hypothetical protein